MKCESKESTKEKKNNNNGETCVLPCSLTNKAPKYIAEYFILCYSETAIAHYYSKCPTKIDIF